MGWLVTIDFLSVGIFFAVFALLPVQHPALDLGMRAYLGTNVLLVLLGYWIRTKKSCKGSPIIIG